MRQLPEEGETAVGGDEEEEDDDEGDPEKNEQPNKVTSSLGHRCLSDYLSDSTACLILILSYLI